MLGFLVAGELITSGGTPWAVVLLGLTVVGALLVLVRLVIGADLSDVVDLGG